MRTKFTLICTFMTLAVLLAGCSGQSLPALETAIPQITEVVPTVVEGVQTAVPTIIEGVQTDVVPTIVEGAQNVRVEDLNGLIAALGAAGVTVEQLGSVEQPFFTAPGQSITVNGETLQVYTYETPETLEADASQVAPDASTVGTSMPAWVDDPHFFKSGRLLVLYVGQNQKILDLLEGAFGPQFAGR